jgi:hypothetical protein
VFLIKLNKGIVSTIKVMPSNVSFFALMGTIGKSFFFLIQDRKDLQNMKIPIFDSFSPWINFPFLLKP